MQGFVDTFSLTARRLLALWIPFANAPSAGDILFDAFLSPNRVIRDDTFGAVLDASFAARLAGTSVALQLLAVAQRTRSLLRGCTWLLRLLVLTAGLCAIHSTHVIGQDLARAGSGVTMLKSAKCLPPRTTSGQVAFHRLGSRWGELQIVLA